MSRDVDSNESGSRTSPLLLWIGVLSGPAAWAIHLAVSYALVQPACTRGIGFLFYVASIATLAVAAAGGVIAWRSWRDSRETDEQGLQGFGGRAGFMAMFGLLANIYFFGGILLESVPLLFLDPCA